MNKQSPEKDWHIYIAECADKTYYTGITNNLIKRIAAHNKGLGAKYTKIRIPIKIVYSELAANRSIASKREHEIKQLSRQEKQALINV